ncbi:hypothetical protein [Sulfurimonas diazotrophicus]|uniref:Uncharacterized protein n=1 Tax=Sulfurimonas diazotrophicus TaxID=3131939 RepID=A0ABZ3HC51_9BACT
MALADFLARFYDKVFIGLYAHNDTLQIGVMTQTRRGEVQVRQRVFFAGLDEEAIAFLQEAVDRTPYNYIAVLTDHERCGALPTCSLSKAKEMAPIVERSRTLCIDEEWMNYCDEEVLYGIQAGYADLAPDAIYTPFAVLHAYFESTMAGAHALYVLITSGGMSLAVVKESHLRFAEQYRCDGNGSAAPMVEKITTTLDTYYGKPCCRGEFVEAVYILDATGSGEELAAALEETLLVEAQNRMVDAAALCAQTCMKENGYGL